MRHFNLVLKVFELTKIVVIIRVVILRILHVDLEPENLVAPRRILVVEANLEVSAFLRFPRETDGSSFKQNKKGNQFYLPSFLMMLSKSTVRVGAGARSLAVMSLLPVATLLLVTLTEYC